MQSMCGARNFYTESKPAAGVLHMSARHLLAEFESLFLGKKLGEGMSRKVYACRTDSALVIKIERRAGYFQNIREWETWNELQYTAAAKWLAPCIDISSCGTILLQKRAQPIREKELPKQMPVFLCDFKLANFGVLEGRVVCCDYGTNLTISQAAGKRMKKVKWL
jgi:hypothetical protein